MTCMFSIIDSDTDPNELEKLLGRGKRDGESREHLDHKKSGSGTLITMTLL